MNFSRCCFSERCLQDSHCKFMKSNNPLQKVDKTPCKTTRTVSNNNIDVTKVIHTFITCIFMNYINCIIIV